MNKLDLKTKALLVIECLTFENVKVSREQQTSLIYKFSHVALSGLCHKCEHKDWELELDEWYTNLVTAGLMDGLEKGTTPSEDLLEIFTVEELKDRGTI